MSAGLDLSSYVGAKTSGWDDRLPPHISPSQLGLFMKCPRQYQQERVLGRSSRTTEVLFTGSAVHLGVENALRYRMDNGIDLGAVEAVEKFQESWWPQALDAERKQKDEDVAWDETEERAKYRASQLFGRYLIEVVPRLQPVAVEEEFVYPVEGLPVPLKGRMDIRCVSTVIDLKTSKQRKSRPEPSWMLQAAIYNAVTGLPVEFHALSCSPKTSEVSIVTPLEREEFAILPTTGQHREYMRTIAALITAIADCMERYGLDQPWPTLGFAHPFACGYCSFRGDCPAWEGES